jgi:peroxiredoxin
VEAGSPFPTCRLWLTDRPSDSAYLNIAHDRPEIALEDIPAEYVLIMIYNENCLACIDEIAVLNQVYKSIESNRTIGGRVKMIGIGMGSKKRNLNHFRQEHRIPFPLFADERKTVFECLGGPVLPTSYLVRLSPKGSNRIEWIQRDHVHRPEDLVERIARILDNQTP